MTILSTVHVSIVCASLGKKRMQSPSKSPSKSPPLKGKHGHHKLHGWHAGRKAKRSLPALVSENSSTH